jgi:hypothetical protein
MFTYVRKQVNIFETFISGFLQCLMYLRKGNTISSNCVADRTGRGSGYRALKNSKIGSPELLGYYGVQGSVCDYVPRCILHVILIDIQLAWERLFYRK